MKRILFSCFLIVSFSTLSFCGDCTNPLLSTFKLPNLVIPRSGKTLSYCLNLQIGQTCCSNETVASFQDRTNSLISELQDVAAKKDQYLTNLNTNFTKEFQKANKVLQDYTREIASIKEMDSEIGNTIQSQFFLFQSFSSQLNRLGDNFLSWLKNYQQTRVTCFRAVLQIQVSAWCLACDPTYKTQGVLNDGTVNASTTVNQLIQRRCIPFSMQSNAFDPLFQAQQSYQRVLDLAEYLEEYRNNKTKLPPLNLFADIYKPQNLIEKTNSFPSRCNSTNCSWQVRNFFSKQFQMNSTILAHGAGIIGNNDLNLQPIGRTTNRRFLQRLYSENEDEEAMPIVIDEEESYQSVPDMQFPNIWSPLLNNTGITFNIPYDPAGITKLTTP